MKYKLTEKGKKKLANFLKSVKGSENFYELNPKSIPVKGIAA